MRYVTLTLLAAIVGLSLYQPPEPAPAAPAAPVAATHPLPDIKPPPDAPFPMPPLDPLKPKTPKAVTPECDCQICNCDPCRCPDGPVPPVAQVRHNPYHKATWAEYGWPPGSVVYIHAGAGPCRQGDEPDAPVVYIDAKAGWTAGTHRCLWDGTKLRFSPLVRRPVAVGSGSGVSPGRRRASRARCSS